MQKAKKIKSLALIVVFLIGALFTISADNIYDLPVKEIKGRSYYYYEVKPKETEYSLCRRFSITREELLKYNPSQRDGLKAYATLYFPVDAFGPGATKPSQDGEAEAVASTPSMPEQQITPDDIEDKKEDVEEKNEVQRVYIAEEQITTEEPRNEAPAENAYVVESDTVTPGEVVDDENIAIDSRNLTLTPDENDIVEPDTLTISILLPFEAQSSAPSKMAQLYTEFYRGFLMGTERLSHGGTDIKLQVFDTAVSDDDFNSLLQTEEIASSDIFIGPDSEQRLTALASKAAETEALVINTFVVSDDVFRVNQSIVQTNIPRVEMYSGAIQKYIDMFPDVTTVFLARVDGEADKVAFTGEMKEHLDEAEKNYKEIVYHGVLTNEDLVQLHPDGKYVFVPVSGSRNEFGKFISGLREFKSATREAGGSVTLFGFPEWTMLRGEQVEQLKELDGVIYSRFVNSDTPEAAALKRSYEKWYGESWSDVEPNQALLGYDLANYVIDALRKGDGNFFPQGTSPSMGVQSSFNIVPVENGGYVNSALYIINYGEGKANRSEVIAVPITSGNNE